MQKWARPFAERFPNLTARVSPLELAKLPTPITGLKSIGESVGCKNLFIKRDDLSSEVYGGNKVRKLEFILGDAKREGISTLVTMGGTGSNHLLATALHAREQGMRTVGVVFNQPENDDTRRNQAADRGAGVTLINVPSKYLLPVYVAASMATNAVKDRKLPRLVAGGGSSPLGALGFVNAGLELAEQVAAKEVPEPEQIYVPYGTGGTAAGLAIGLLLGGLRAQVVAVRVIDRLLANRPRLLLLSRSISKLLTSAGDKMRLPQKTGANIKIVNSYIGKGYGYVTEAAESALEQFSTLEGVTLEPTYTAKAAAAFLDWAPKTEGPMLFWNTFSSADISKWVEAGSNAAK